MNFQVGTTQGGEPSWWLYSSSDMVAWAGETFDSTSNANRACREFKAGAATARYELYESDGWRWRAWRGSDKVASSGEKFYSKSNAERAADNVRRNAGGATGP